MILCDYCGGFYHYDCMNINKELVRKTDLYKCSECVQKDVNDPMYHEGMHVKHYMHT